MLSTGYIANVILNLLIFVILASVYSYILKLENSGCVCSKHPNREFIKIFSIFALIFLFIITFIPTNYIIETFGNLIAGLFAFVKFIFYIICIVYFYMILEYTRFLINEKCKCSEDMRREFIMVGSIIEVCILLLIFIVIIILPVIFNSVSIIVENMSEFEKEVSTAIRHPYDSIKSVPSKLKSATKIISKIASKSKDGIKKMSKSNNY